MEEVRIDASKEELRLGTSGGRIDFCGGREAAAGD